MKSGLDAKLLFLQVDMLSCLEHSYVYLCKKANFEEKFCSQRECICFSCNSVTDVIETQIQSV